MMNNNYYILKSKEHLYRTCVLFTLLGATVALIAVTLFFNMMAPNYISLKNHNEIMAKLNSQMVSVINNKDNEIANVSLALAELNDETKTYKAKIEYLQTRNENEFNILRKYWYIFKDAPKNCGLTVSDIVHIDDVAKAKNINPHLITGLIDLESHYTVTAKNRKSSATGLGQILESTGRSIYTKMLSRDGTYVHRTMATNAKTNIDMTSEYLKYLMKHNNSDVKKVLQSYNGYELGPVYYKIINNKMMKIGTNITATGYR